MDKVRTWLYKTISFIRQIDREYVKEKYRQARNIRREDIILFVKTYKRYFFYAFLIFLLIMLLIPIATYAYFVRDLSSKDRILNKKNAGVVLLDRNDTPFFTLFGARTRHPVSLDDLPEYTSHAFVAIEDKDFYHHPGFSIEGIGRAIRENVLSESFAQGGSTIDQQLIKNAILSPDKKLLRMYQELVLALELERRYTKNDILELYINTNYYGEGAFGIQDAAQRYFSKDAKDLTLSESALLAGIIRAPSYYSPISGNEQAALDRRDLVLKLMHDQKYITEEEMKKAQNEDIELNPTEDDLNKTGIHFALMIQDELTKEYGEQEVAQSGFVVKTTLDLPLQKVAQEAVAAQVQRLRGLNASNGAAVAIQPDTGRVLALVGSHDYSDEENGRINMALRPRQPGSSFKPIIYAKAFDEKVITPSTQIKDEATSFGSYKPHNYDYKFHGDVLVRYALANSLNIPAVKVMNMIGVKAGIEQARALGITTLSDNVDYGLPFALGDAEVPLIEMTNVYATFADEGKWKNYTLYTEIRDKNGNVIKTPQKDEKRGLSQSVAYLIWSILSDNKARVDTFGTSLNLDRPAAVKTGTTEENRDALTLGYTPQIAVGAWVGNNDNSPMSGVAGSFGAAPIWRQIMTSYLKDKSKKEYRKPAGVIEEKVCYEDGLKIDFATSSAYTEFYLRGTAPTKLCNIPTPTPTQKEEKKDDNNSPTDTPVPTQKPSSPTNTPIPPTPTSTPIITLPISPLPSDTPTPTPTLTPTPTI